MILNEEIKKNFEKLYKTVDITMQSNSLTKEQIQNFLISFERARYNILNEIKEYNKNVEFEYEKISTIDNEYKAELNENILKIYVPEVVLSYKGLKTHTYKRMMMNIAEVTKTYANLFKTEVFIFVKIFDKTSGWDIDNKNIKPIADGLILSNVITDDKISKMYYCVKGKLSETPHTEIYISGSENAELILQKYSK